jgi:hypothetical protein
MRPNWRRRLLLSVAIITIAAPALFAQAYEVNPYGGFFWANHTNAGRLRDNAIWGGRAGVFLDPSFELEGNVGYINHFQVTDIDVRNRGFLYEIAGNYNFSEKAWPVSRQFTPFVVVSAGAITSHLKDVPTFTFVGPQGQSIEMTHHNTFFQVSYGGGFKSVKLWGPMGLRFDVRGRTLPNYYHSTPTLLEVTGGVNFMWGER